MKFLKVEKGSKAHRRLNWLGFADGIFVLVIAVTFARFASNLSEMAITAGLFVLSICLIYSCIRILRKYKTVEAIK